MSSKTKIVVLRMKEIIYTAIFAGLAILLIALCFIMFRHGNDNGSEKEETRQTAYVPGIYSASLSLGSEQVNVEVTVDADQIRAVALVPLSEAVATMYPLMQPTMEGLAEQIVNTQSTENLTYPDSSRYTSMALLKAVDTALEKARP